MQTRFAPRAFNACAAATVLGLWLLTQPYTGLRHDAVLYLAQALQSARPAQFGHDLFFAFGSQDSFSAYSLLFAPLFAHAEIWPWQILIVGLAHVAVLAALWRLLPSGLCLQERWLGMAAIALLQLGYGGLSVFAVCEPFLTARTLAESLSLWALAMGRCGRHRLAWGLVLLAGAMHPLMALPVAACLWLLACLRDRRWLWLLSLALPVVLLAALQVAPFGGLLHSYPDAWWRLVEEVNEQVLVERWLPEDWAIIFADAVVLLGAARILHRDARPLLQAVLAVSLGFVLISWLGSQLLHNQLLTQLQLWRALWILHALALAYLPALLLAICRTGPSGWAAAASVACLAGIANLYVSASWMVAVWSLLHLWLWRKGLAASRFVWLASTAASAVILLGVGAASYLALSAMTIDDANFLDYSKAGIALVALGVPTLCLLAWLWQGPFSVASGRAGRLCMALTLLLAIAGATQWDRRTPLVRYMESHLHAAHPFEAVVPQQAQVYWDNSLAAAWFVLKRPSYYSKQQGAGLLFNKATAKEFGARHSVFKPIIQRRKSCELMSRLLGKLPADMMRCRELAEDELAAACRAAPLLDYAVAAQRFTRAPLAVWEVPGASDLDRFQYLYACRSFR